MHTHTLVRQAIQTPFSKQNVTVIIMYNNISIIIMFNESPGDLLYVLYCINRARRAERRPQKRAYTEIRPASETSAPVVYHANCETSKQWPLTISVWRNYYYHYIYSYLYSDGEADAANSAGWTTEYGITPHVAVVCPAGRERVEPEA